MHVEPRSPSSNTRQLHFQLRKMASANSPNYVIFGDDAVSCKVFADSYLKYKYFRSNRIENLNYTNVVHINPHVNVLNDGSEVNSIKLFNGAKGSLTMNKLLEDKFSISMWASNLPSVTLLHVGACDIANEAIGRKERLQGEFNHYVRDFLTNLEKIARETTRCDKSEFDAKWEKHIFLLVGIPDWGDFGTGYYKHSLNDKQFHAARRSANDSLRLAKSGLWTKFKTVVFMPCITGSEDRPICRNMRPGDVHLYGYTAEEYADQILAVLSRLFCSHCKLKEDYDKEEHKRESLLGPCKRQQQGAGASV